MGYLRLLHRAERFGRARCAGAVLSIAFMMISIATAGGERLELQSSVPRDPVKEPVTITALPQWDRVEDEDLRFNWYFYDEPSGEPDVTSEVTCSPNDCENTQTYRYPLGNYTYRVSVERKRDFTGWTHVATARESVFLPSKIVNLVPGIKGAAATLDQPIQFLAAIEPSRDMTGPVALNYSFGDGTPYVLSGDETPLQHTFANVGLFTTTVTGSNFVGTVSGSSVVIVQAPVQGGVPLYNVSGTAGSTTNLILEGVTGTNLTFTWHLDDGYVEQGDESNFQHVFNTTGVYNVTVEARNLVSMANYTLQATIVPSIVPEAIEITTPIVLAIVGILLVLGLSYHRWIYSRRGVEVANHDFVLSPRRRSSYSFSSPLANLGAGRRRAGSGYGALEGIHSEL